MNKKFRDFVVWILLWVLLPLWLFLIVVEKVYDFFKAEEIEENISLEENRRRHNEFSKNLEEKRQWWWAND